MLRTLAKRMLGHCTAHPCTGTFTTIVDAGGIPVRISRTPKATGRHCTNLQKK
jgi:hypothetical protein